MVPAVSTRTEMALAEGVRDLWLSVWRDAFAAAFGTRGDGG
jgi:hypothetical protein